MSIVERKRRGLAIAATGKVTRKGKVWVVPSLTSNRRYRVSLGPKQPHCTCPDHGTHSDKCKHVFAAEFAMKRKYIKPKSVKRTRSVKGGQARKVYPQNWPAYNKAQTNEKDYFLSLLHDLCAEIPDQPQTLGRPRLPLSDALFSACFKIYSTVSARRFMSDLRDAQAKGFIRKAPHFNSIFNYLDNESIEPVLQSLIRKTSMPLKMMENDFAVDSSGFTSSRFIRWYDHQYGAIRRQHDWVKVHLMCGVKTNIVTAAVIKDRDASDTKLLPELVWETSNNFVMREIFADKGYASLTNYDVIARRGAVPYIGFKSIHTGKAGGLWAEMFHYFNYRRMEFLAHYHKRSNVESTFSMIKAKFRDHVRSRTDVAMKNEVLCKIICHNICCVIQEAHELGIQPTLWANLAPAQKVI